jgi:CHAT domain-containing protein
MASISRCAGGRRSERPSPRLLAAAALALALALLHARGALAADDGCAAPRGPLQLRVQALQAAHAQAGDGLERARRAGRLGAAWLALGRDDEAEPLLREAAAAPLAAPERAAAAMDLGNLLYTRGQGADARAHWAAAAALIPADAELQARAALNALRLRPAAERLPALQQALPQVAALADAAARARLALNLAAQAQALAGEGAQDEAGALSWRALDFGRQQALAAGDERLAAEAFEGLAALYEAQQRPAEALALAEQGIAHARRVDARERLMTLEGRSARLSAALGDDARALRAYRRAVEHAQAVRSDIPVRYRDGRSSFRETLAPLYLGLTDQLLRRADTQPAAERQALLRQARDTVELTKQTELADYLRERCSVDAATRAVAAPPPRGTAIYYPIVLPDRLELLLQTPAGLERRSVAIGEARLRDEVLAFVAALRDGEPLLARAQALHRTLVAPLETLLAQERIDTLVVVPDGVLRLLPLAALHDGRGWLLQRMAVATVPALSLTAAPRSGRRPLRALLAGLSDPGPVIDKLPADVVDAVLEPGAPPETPARGPDGPGAARGAPLDAQQRSALREALTLPGVKTEIESLSTMLPGKVLLDGAFTLQALREQLRDEAYPVVHIASHGLFGHDIDSTFIMTYDELLTLDALQALLQGARPRDQALELLTLSACQTAEGDDRAPLGMSGSALKARARSALGTLWPVADESARLVMDGFYRRLARGELARVQALRQAQLALLQQREHSHPFHWAPFILIGDWQ